MSTECHAANASRKPVISFPCDGCGLTLSVPHQDAGISGPCPACGTLLTSPSPPPSNPLPNPPSNPLPIKRRKSSSSRSITRHENHSRGHILADAGLDYQHQEQNDSVKTLKILALTILVACLCLAATWFLKAWVAQ